MVQEILVPLVDVIDLHVLVVTPGGRFVIVTVIWSPGSGSLAFIVALYLLFTKALLNLRVCIVGKDEYSLGVGEGAADTIGDGKAEEGGEGEGDGSGGGVNEGMGEGDGFNVGVGSGEGSDDGEGRGDESGLVMGGVIGYS